MLHPDATWQRQSEEHARLGQRATYADDFRLTIGEYGDDEVVVVEFRGHEAVNELFSFDVTFFVPVGGDASRTANMNATSAFAGQRARLLIPTGNGTSRSVHGIVSEVVLAGMYDERFVCHVRIVPTLWCLTQTSDSRVFQNMSTDAIVTAVLTQHDVDVSFKLADELPNREYALQYDESDYAFVMRLLAEDGLCFWFEHQPFDSRHSIATSATRERVVVANSCAFYAPIEHGDQLVFRPDSDALASGDSDLTSFRLVERVMPQAVTLRRYDFERANPQGSTPHPTPELPTNTTLQGGIGDSAASDDRISLATREHYEPHDDDHEVLPSQTTAQRRLEQHRAGFTAYGASLCRRLQTGFTFSLAEGEHAAIGQQFVVTRLHHRGSNVGSDRRYDNHLEAMASALLARPGRPPRRALQVVETATVTGEAGKEIDTDAHGRVHVQFHWDRLGNNDAASSCWLRVMQPWSGPGYGFQFVPRVGTEVLVSFLGGDPDRPVVLGCMPGPANAVPHHLPDNATRSAIRSQSTPDGAGFNEIVFDDEAGGEVLQLRAQRNLDQQALGDHMVRVGGNQKTTVAVKRSATVEGDDELIVSGSQQVSLGGSANLKIDGGLQQTVSDGRKTTVGGCDKLEVAEAIDVVVGGELCFVVGSSAPSKAVISASDEVTLIGTNRVRLTSPTAIELVCGTSVISIEPDTITVRAEHVDVDGTTDVTLRHDTSKLVVADKIDAGSDAIELTGSSSNLNLTDVAELKGNSVSLGSGQPSVRTADSPELPSSGKATFNIAAPPGIEAPFTVRVVMPDGSVVDKETDGSGQLQLDGASGDNFKVLEVRKGSTRLQYLPG